MRKVLFVVLLAACGARASEPAPGAYADFIDATGAKIGTATLHPESNGVRVKVRVNLPGRTARGFHVHQVGRCEPPFDTAGSHFNPSGRRHGSMNPEGSHAGDLANLPEGWTNDNAVEVTANGVSLDQLLDADGSSLVIHANPDDYRTDPSGSSGARVACAVIRRA